MPVYEINYIRRVVSQEDPLPVKTQQHAVAYALQHCYNIDEMCREKVYAIYINAAHNVIGHLLISEGGFECAPFDKKLVLKGAIDSVASAIVLIHNHPTGNTSPSQYDIQATKDIKDLMKIINVNLIDHVILGDKDYFSFNAENKFPLTLDTIRQIRKEATNGTIQLRRIVISDDHHEDNIALERETDIEKAEEL